MVQLGCYLRQKAPSSPLSLLSELSSVYPQTSPLVNRLGLSPAVSFFLHLPLPPSPCLMACLFLSEPLPCSCDGIKERGGKGSKRKWMHVGVVGGDGTGACSAGFALLASLAWSGGRNVRPKQNCCWRIKNEPLSSPVARPALAAQRSTGDISDKHTGLSGNYRDPQIMPGQPHGEAVGLCEKATRLSSKSERQPELSAAERQAADTWKSPNRLNTH